MAGYLGQLGQPGMTGQNYASGFGLLARDTTALEENDRGWNNLPPWGYKRNRPQDNAPPSALAGWLELANGRGMQAGHPRVLVQSRGQVAGLGSCCNGCSSGHGCVSGLGSLGATSANALEAANAFAEAILSTGIFGTSLDGVRMPEYSRANGFLAQVDDANLAEAILGWARNAEDSINNVIKYSYEPGVVGVNISQAQMAVEQLQSIARGQPVQQVAGDEWTDSTTSGEAHAYAHKDDEDLSLFQDFAMSDAGAGVIHTGAFTAGVTGINRDAILEEGKRSDLNVAADIAAGEKVASMGKYAAYIGVAVVAYLAAKKAGLV